jgi:hypothetical protein
MLESTLGRRHLVIPPKVGIHAPSARVIEAGYSGSAGRNAQRTPLRMNAAALA